MPAQQVPSNQYDGDADGDGDVTRQEFGQVIKDFAAGKIDYAQMLEILKACGCA